MASIAQIYGGSVVQITPDEFPIHPDVTFVDITAVSPEPAIGWTATLAAGVWSFAPPVLQLPQQPQLRTDLAALDMSISRGLEDYWASVGFDTTKLPAATQAKLAQKLQLRAQLAALIAAGTP